MKRNKSLVSIFSFMGMLKDNTATLTSFHFN